MVLIWYSPSHPKTKLQIKRLELEDHVKEEALSLNLPPKLGLVRKIVPTSFFQLPTNKRLNRIFIFLCSGGPLKRAKQNTIGVTKRINAK